MVTNHYGETIFDWKINDLRSIKPIEMGVKLICEMYNAAVMDLVYENPPGPDDSGVKRRERILIIPSKITEISQLINYGQKFGEFCI